MLFYYLDHVLGRYPVKEKAWEQFSHSEKILNLLSLQTKNTKAKPPAQIQQWSRKIYNTVKQWITLPSEKIQKYIADLKSALTYKSITQQHLLTHIGRIRHMASTYRPLAAFA